MLSRMSSLVRSPGRLAGDDPRDESWLAGAVAVVDHPRREVDRRVCQAVQRLRSRRHDLGVCHVLGVEGAQLVVGARALRRRVRPAAGRRSRTPVMISAGAVPGMLEWMPSSSGARLHAHRSRDRGAPVAALRDEPRVAEPLHQHHPGTRDPDRVPAGGRGLAENPCPGSEGITTWKASEASPPCAVGSVSGSMILSCSMIEPGQPCVTMMRQRVLVRRADVDEVDVEPVDLGNEVAASALSLASHLRQS